MYKDCLKEEQILEILENKPLEQNIQKHLVHCSECLKKVSYIKKNEKSIKILTPKKQKKLLSLQTIAASIAIVCTIFLYDKYLKPISQQINEKEYLTQLEYIKEDILFNEYLKQETNIFEEDIIEQILPKKLEII